MAKIELSDYARREIFRSKQEICAMARERKIEMLKSYYEHCARKAKEDMCQDWLDIYGSRAYYAGCILKKMGFELQ